MQQFTALLVTHDVEEAVTLADRVVLIEAGQIALDVRVDLPRPRQRSNVAFAAIVESILGRVLRTHSFSAQLSRTEEELAIH